MLYEKTIILNMSIGDGMEYENNRYSNLNRTRKE